MIPQQKDKKRKSIYIYILLFILITSINNKNFYDKELFSNKLIFEINGLSFTNNQKLIRDLDNINKNNIFKLDEKKLFEKITENNSVLNFLAKKNYPNKIDIKINRVTYVGKIYVNERLSLIGSNGKLINHDVNKMKDLPYFYGNFKREDFLEFLTVINKVGLETKDISTFYFFPSGRWDIKFRDGLLLKLPNKDLMNTLSKVLLLKNDQNFINSKLIDLRIKNRIISNG
jgi:cell division septal protein FtsQ